MNRAHENAFHAEFMKELSDAHGALARDPQVRAVILCSGQKGFFSNGLDAHDLLAGDQKQRLAIFTEFYRTVSVLVRFPKLHVSLMEGHAMAGGAIIAATSDFRFCADAPMRISFSEARIGIGIPGSFLQLVRAILPPSEVARALLLCEAYKPAEAKEAGLVHNVFAAEEARLKVRKFVENILKYPDSSFLLTRNEIRKPLLEAFAIEPEFLQEELNRFICEELTEGLSAILEKRRPHFH